MEITTFRKKKKKKRKLQINGTSDAAKLKYDEKIYCEVFKYNWSYVYLFRDDFVI